MWGYELVECSSRGMCVSKDEWDRDEVLGGASQVAMFRRRDGPREAKIRHLAREHAEYGVATNHTSDAGGSTLDKGLKESNVLLARHVHEGDSHARSPLSPADIHHRIHQAYDNARTRIMSVYQLWLSGEVSRSCGGYLSVLLQAIEAANELNLIRDDKAPREYWDVSYAAEKTWISPSPTENSLSDLGDVENDSDSDIIINEMDSENPMSGWTNGWPDVASTGQDEKKLEQESENIAHTFASKSIDSIWTKHGETGWNQWTTNSEPDTADSEWRAEWSSSGGWH
jgi:hypothetical protein